MAGHPDRIAAVPPLWVRTMTEVGPLPGEGFPSSPSAHPGQNPTETHRGRGKGVGRLRDISAQEMALDAKHTGCMVALYPNRTDAEKLAIRGGEPPEQLHVTLAFLGEARNIDEQVLTEVVRNWAAITPQISGTISGYGYFLEGPKPVTYWSVDLPRLPEHREALVLALEAAGVPPKKDHGFVPHMTVAYAKRRDKPPVGHRFRFGSAVVAYADKRTRFSFGGINQAEYARALAIERRRRGLDLAGPIQFDPELHPRDLEGRFRETLRSLNNRQKVKLPDGHTVERREREYIVKGPEGGRGQAITAMAPSVAARAALASSARSEHPKSVGGAKPVELESSRDHSKIRAYHGRHAGTPTREGALYTAEDREHAEAYGPKRLYPTGEEKLYKVEYDAANPLVLDTPQKVTKAFKDAGVKPLGRTNAKSRRPPTNFATIEAPAVVEWARKQGHDAVVIPPEAFEGQKHNELLRTWGMPQAIIVDGKRAKVVEL